MHGPLNVRYEGCFLYDQDVMREFKKKSVLKYCIWITKEMYNFRSKL